MSSHEWSLVHRGGFFFILPYLLISISLPVLIFGITNFSQLWRSPPLPALLFHTLFSALMHTPHDAKNSWLILCAPPSAFAVCYAHEHVLKLTAEIKNKVLQIIHVSAIPWTPGTPQSIYLVNIWISQLTTYLTNRTKTSPPPQTSTPINHSTCCPGAWQRRTQQELSKKQYPQKRTPPNVQSRLLIQEGKKYRKEDNVKKITNRV